MTAASVWLVVLLGIGIDPGAGPQDLIEQLGSTQFAEREQATVALERLGPRVVPALRAARQAADPEVRYRITMLLARIERESLLRPTYVSLRYQNAPLEEVARSISSQTGARFVFIRGRRPASRTITLISPEPLPFWQAVDRMGEAGDVHLDSAARIAPNPPTFFPMVDGPAPRPMPAFDSGPFRLALLDCQRKRGYVTLELHLMAEPRLRICGGEVSIKEAIDEVGQPFPPAHSGGQAQNTQCSGGYEVGGAIPTYLYLKLPSPDAKTLKRLKGNIALHVAARQSEPQSSVLLSEAGGRTFSSGAVSLLIRAIEKRSDRETYLEADLRYEGGVEDDLDFDESQLELVDSQGRSAALTYQSRTRWGRRGRLRLGYQAADAKPESELVTLRFHALNRTSADVAFEFRELPVP